ncbi:MAG TPA: AAA family ATPase [Stellaceae bacterium]|nr:AAA family ATPase [Stellaceae bacterium]
MRLTAFALENYGNFAATRLSLDPDPGCINLVLAPNGGGKSVLRQAFHDLLFGIPGQTRMAFRFGYAGMRLLAEGIDGAGGAFAIGRRKGVGNTLIDGQGNSVDPLVLKGLIGEADEALFERLFALDSHRLRSGAEAMLASGGDLAEALFAAGSGISGLRRIREEFEAKRDRLAPEHRAKLPQFYQALDALAKAQKERREATIRPQTWQELSAKLAFARSRLASLVNDQAKGQAEFERLQRVKRVRPWLEQLKEAREERAAAAHAPHLAADIEERWREAQTAAERAELELGNATAGFRTIAASRAAEEPDRKLLDAGRRIDELERERNEIAGDRRELPRLEASCRQTAARLDEILSALGAGSTGEIAAILPNGPPVAAARDLIKRHAVLSERLSNAEAEAAGKEREIAAAAAELDTLGEPEDTSELAALAAEARADGDPARRLTDLWAKLAQQETQLASALAKVPLWNRGLPALAAIVPPTRQRTDRAAAALDAAQDARTRAEHDYVRLCGEREAALERLAREREGKPVPDAAAIAAARAHRDLGWSLIRRSRFEGEALDAEIASYADSLGLAGVFERALGAADRLADRRDEEGRRLARIAEQERLIAAREKEIAGAEERLAKARAAHCEAAERWAALTGDLGFAEPPEAAGLVEFLAARETVLDARAARDLAQQAVTAEMTRQEAMRRRFAGSLPAEKCASLAEALFAAQQVIEHGREAKQERDRVRAALGTLRHQYRQALDNRKAAQQALAKWEADWRACLAQLNRPPGETPAAVERAIELIEEAHQERRKLADLEHRIAGIRRTIAEFETRLAALVAATAPDLSAAPAEAAVAELRRRLDENRKVDTRREQLAEQEEEARAKVTRAAARQKEAAAEREALRQRIGGTDDADIARRIALAEQRRAAEAKLSEVERKLAELGDGWPIDTLEGEAAGIAADKVDAEIARLKDETERIAADRQTAAGDEQRLLAELNAIGASDNAIDAEERCQAAIASLTRISAEALLYHAAACLLRHGIERLRNSGDNSLVRRIGMVFARVTGGAYAGIAVDEDDKGTPFLSVLAADGKTEKRVGELSEGTRDQLFLALRLVMLEDYAGKAPALPFIADDLLQTFDDYGRTADALAALADLSRHVQVIVLSHHRGLIDVARALPAGAVNVCELAG